jgi:predicted nucleic acid-binding protein
VTRAVVDASVAVKWVTAERFATNALRVIECYELASPALVYAEVGNALAKKEAVGDIDPGEAVRKMREITRADIDTIPNEYLAAEAVRLALEMGHPVYDCFYLALAMAEEIPLITADGEFVARARRVGLAERVVSIEDVH